MDKLRLLKLFLAVVNDGSFVAAALNLGLSPSTISKAVTRLEESLGIQLFQRNTRKLRLTTSGEQYAAAVKNFIEQLEYCENNMKQSNNQPQGTLRINIPISYGRLYITPMIKQFYILYPDIKIDLSYSDEYVDIIEQRIDVCIRSGTVKDSRLIIRQLSPIDFFICASPTYLKKQGIPKTVQEFPEHRWVRFRYKQTGKLMPIITQGNSTQQQHPDESYIVDDGEALAELCAAGLGLTQIPHFIARNWLQKGSIVSLFPAYQAPDQGVFIMYPKRDYLPARVKKFVNFICQEIEMMDETPMKTWAKDIRQWKEKV
ncbi:MAG: LysR family transcriptional regulator [Gammaproteobacteria bacterium]|nr:LysR family transcriptional regulator [Gammaproteobacteria bacterium]